MLWRHAWLGCGAWQYFCHGGSEPFIWNIMWSTHLLKNWSWNKVIFRWKLDTQITIDNTTNHTDRNFIKWAKNTIWTWKLWPGMHLPVVVILHVDYSHKKNITLDENILSTRIQYNLCTSVIFSSDLLFWFFIFLTRLSNYR